MMQKVHIILETTEDLKVDMEAAELLTIIGLTVEDGVMVQAAIKQQVGH